MAVMHGISSHTLLDYVKEMADPKYKGRLTGTAEYDASAKWTADLLAGWKIKPAGDKGTFYQKFPNPYTLVLPGRVAQPRRQAAERRRGEAALRVRGGVLPGFDLRLRHDHGRGGLRRLRRHRARARLRRLRRRRREGQAGHDGARGAGHARPRPRAVQEVAALLVPRLQGAERREARRGRPGLQLLHRQPELRLREGLRLGRRQPRGVGRRVRRHGQEARRRREADPIDAQARVVRDGQGDDDEERHRASPGGDRVERRRLHRGDRPGAEAGGDRHRRAPRPPRHEPGADAGRERQRVRRRRDARASRRRWRGRASRSSGRSCSSRSAPRSRA